MLNLKPLLEQVVQVVRQKQESYNHLILRMGFLHNHCCLVSDSRTLVAGLEEKVKTKQNLATLDVDILSWTQQMNWMRLKSEATQAERARLVTHDLSSVEQELDNTVNTGFECF